MSTIREVPIEEIRARLHRWESERLPKLRANYSPNYNHYCAIVDGLRQELRDAESGIPVIYRGFTADDVLAREPGSEAIQQLVLDIGTGIRSNQRLTTGATLGSIKARPLPSTPTS